MPKPNQVPKLFASKVKMCKRGHEFIGSNCQICQKERARIWNQKNREHVAARLKKWRQENRDRFNSNQRRYTSEKREKVNEYARDWYQNNSSRIRLRGIWKNMIRRCTNPNAFGYKSYGGRGIAVCNQWIGKDGFEKFVEDIGPYPTVKHTIDRIDNNGNYEPGNVRWATRKEQSVNRRGIRNIEYDGKVLCLKDWAAELFIPYPTLLRRIVTLGWSIEKAFTEPPSGQFKVHGALCKRAVSWLKSEKACELVTSESVFVGTHVERPDAIGWNNSGVSYLIECKMGRGEFFADTRKYVRKNPESGMGCFRYYLVPYGLIDVVETPDNWGLLYAGESIVKIKDADPFQYWNIPGEESIIKRLQSRYSNA